MKTLVKISTAIIITLLFASTIVIAQQTPKQIKAEKKVAIIKSKIDAQRYTFIAQYAQPLRGTQKYLTSEYDLVIRKDSVIAYLPYFGRVYMDAPTNPSEAGLMFTSTKFDYVITENKKGGWNILITLHDVRRTTKLRLQIFNNGSTTLQVMSNSRDSISFSGYIDDSEKK